MDVIETDGLTKIYETHLKRGNIVALEDVDLRVKLGEIFGLLGPNGAGKTSLMKILLGITKITSGRAVVYGLPPSDPASRMKVGYLPENHRFPDHLTGLGLLELAGRMHALPQKAIDQQTEKLLPLVGMDRWANVKVRKYSKGMAQRIGLAQALMGDPDLLLLDEPTDGVDPVGKMEIRQVLQKIRQEGRTILLNSHLLSEVESVADRVAILSKGRLVKVDTVENLTRRQSQYDIRATIGNNLVEIPAETAKVITISSDGLIVEVQSDDKLNHIIDILRMKRILIKSIKPMTITLEQSFFEIVTEKKGENQ
jgi:ABC-2 type transport system ATP-binding protein